MTKEAIDLSGFDEVVERQEKGIVVDIFGMDGKTKIGLQIRVAGPDSERAQLAQQEMTDELIEAQDMRVPSAKDALVGSRRYLAKITMEWAPAVKIDGEELTYSEENAVKLYTRHPFIAEQVNRAAGNRKAFTKG